MRERLVTLGSLGRWLDRILSSWHPFTKNQHPIICLERTMIQQSEVLRCSLTMADSSFDETVDNNPVIFENGSKARLLMNINEHAKYYKPLSLCFLLLFFFPLERLVASPVCTR